MTSVMARERIVEGFVVAKKMAAPGWVRSRTWSRSFGFGAWGSEPGRNLGVRGGEEVELVLVLDENELEEGAGSSGAGLIAITTGNGLRDWDAIARSALSGDLL